MIPPGQRRLLREWSFSSGQRSKRALEKPSVHLTPHLPSAVRSDNFLLCSITLRLYFTGSLLHGSSPGFLFGCSCVAHAEVKVVSLYKHNSCKSPWSHVLHLTNWNCNMSVWCVTNEVGGKDWAGVTFFCSDKIASVKTSKRMCLSMLWCVSAYNMHA